MNVRIMVNLEAFTRREKYPPTNSFAHYFVLQSENKMYEVRKTEGTGRIERREGGRGERRGTERERETSSKEKEQKDRTRSVNWLEAHPNNAHIRRVI